VSDEKRQNHDKSIKAAIIGGIFTILAAVIGGIFVIMGNDDAGGGAPAGPTEQSPIQTSPAPTTSIATQLPQQQTSQTQAGADSDGVAKMSVSPDHLTMNQEFTVSGSGFPPSSAFLINVGDAIADYAQTNSTGMFRLKLRLIRDPGCGMPVDVVATDQQAAVVTVTQLHCTA
jgi:hypothetical protein